MKDYVTIAAEADRMAEAICKECSIQRTPGNPVRVNYDTLYPVLFLEVFHDMLQEPKAQDMIQSPESII